MSSTTVYAVRHGETKWNREGKQQGHLDSPLTERGIKQAEAVAEGLVGRGIEHIYSSDLGRAVQTAEIIGARLGLAVETDKRLRERNFGELQGLTMEESSRRYGEEWLKYRSDDPDYRPPGGESAREHFECNMKGMKSIVRAHGGKTVLVVAHGGVLGVLFRNSFEMPPSGRRPFSIFNGAINRFTVNGESWRLDTWGELSHLNNLTTLDEL
jgi:probable phosphoglycerate mutase